MEIQCPSCNEDLIIDGESLDIVFECPSCSQKIEIGDEPLEGLLSSRDDIQEEVRNDSIQTDVENLGSTSIESSPETVEMKNDTPVKNPYIIPAAMICAAILAGFWMLKSPTAKAPDFSIHMAAMFGNTEAIQQHLAAGTDVNAKYLDRSVPLDFAAMAGHKEVVKILIEEGGDVNAINADGHTPLDMAEDHPEVANLLRKHGGKHSIYGAASQGNIEAVKEHLADGSDVNAKDGVGRTPLYRAAYKGRKEIVELLITNGADVNAKDEDGETPLDSAEEDFWGSSELKAAKKEIADLLRKHGGKTGEELKAEGK